MNYCLHTMHTHQSIGEGDPSHLEVALCAYHLLHVNTNRTHAAMDGSKKGEEGLQGDCLRESKTAVVVLLVRPKAVLTSNAAQTFARRNMRVTALT